MMGHSTGDPYSPTNRQPDPPHLPFTPFTTHAATALSFRVAVSLEFWVAGPTMVGLFATRICNTDSPKLYQLFSPKRARVP